VRLVADRHHVRADHATTTLEIKQVLESRPPPPNETPFSLTDDFTSRLTKALP
jgi:hypothetical protein